MNDNTAVVLLASTLVLLSSVFMILFGGSVIYSMSKAQPIDMLDDAIEEDENSLKKTNTSGHQMLKMLIISGIFLVALSVCSASIRVLVMEHDYYNRRIQVAEYKLERKIKRINWAISKVLL